MKRCNRNGHIHTEDAALRGEHASALVGVGGGGEGRVFEHAAQRYYEHEKISTSGTPEEMAGCIVTDDYAHSYSMATGMKCDFHQKTKEVFPRLDQDMATSGGSPHITATDSSKGLGKCLHHLPGTLGGNAFSTSFQRERSSRTGC